MKRSHRRYRTLRDRVRREQSLCPQCAAQGLTVAGAEVDHIVPLAHGGALLDRANLQHLCAACHDAKTRRQQQGGIESTGGRPAGHHMRAYRARKRAQGHPPATPVPRVSGRAGRLLGSRRRANSCATRRIGTGARSRRRPPYPHGPGRASSGSISATTRA